MPEIPHLDRAVGLPSSDRDKQEQYERHLINRFDAHKDTRFDGEIEKNKHDRDILEIAQSAVDRYLAPYGRTKVVSIPFENIHLVAPGGTEKLTQGRLRDGATSTLNGGMIIDRDPSDAQFGVAAFHEFFHLKSYSAAQMTKSKDGALPKEVEYRHGFAIVKRDGTAEYFKDLEEAVIAYFTHCFYIDYVKKNRSRVFSDATWTEPDISRNEELRVMNGLVDETWERNREKYPHRDDVLDLFIRAQINGDLLPIAQLIDKTYGKGSFRKLGELTGRLRP